MGDLCELILWIQVEVEFHKEVRGQNHTKTENSWLNMSVDLPIIVFSFFASQSLINAKGIIFKIIIIQFNIYIYNNELIIFCLKSGLIAIFPKILLNLKEGQ